MTEEEKIICKSFLHDADNTHSCNEYKLLMELLEQEPTTKNDLGVDCSLDDFIKYCKRTFGVELTVKKSDNSDTYAKLFGTTKNDLGIDDEERELALMYLEQIKDDYIEGVGYERHPLPEYYAIETAMKSLALPSVTPQKPKTGYLSIDDAMSVFDDFMCGDADEDSTETFLKMLKDKAESEDK